MRPGSGFGMVLDGKHFGIIVADAFVGIIVQIGLAGAELVLLGRVYRKAVVLAGDLDSISLVVDDRMVDAAVTELHLEGRKSGGLRNQLVAEANSE